MSYCDLLKTERKELNALVSLLGIESSRKILCDFVDKRSDQNSEGGAVAYAELRAQNAALEQRSMALEAELVTAQAGLDTAQSRLTDLEAQVQQYQAQKPVAVALLNEYDATYNFYCPDFHRYGRECQEEIVSNIIGDVVNRFEHGDLDEAKALHDTYIDILSLEWCRSYVCTYCLPEGMKYKNLRTSDDGIWKEYLLRLEQFVNIVPSCQFYLREAQESYQKVRGEAELGLGNLDHPYDIGLKEVDNFLESANRTTYKELEERFGEKIGGWTVREYVNYLADLHKVNIDKSTRPYIIASVSEEEQNELKEQCSNTVVNLLNENVLLTLDKLDDSIEDFKTPYISLVVYEMESQGKLYYTTYPYSAYCMNTPERLRYLIEHCQAECKNNLDSANDPTNQLFESHYFFEAKKLQKLIDILTAHMAKFSLRLVASGAQEDI